MTDPVNERKVEHVRAIQSDREIDRQRGHFDAVHLRHRALPELALDDVDPRVIFLGKELAFPLLISSMTGGDHEMLRRVNVNLARAAEQCHVAMGVGSQRVMFSEPAARASFELRSHAPGALLFANLGAVQLNYGFDLQQCRAAIEAVGADGLFLHLNALQEAVQPEGDTDFRDLASKIGAVAKGLEQPVIVKEVGAGIAPQDARLLLDQGITYLDVAGAGGTSWSRVEHHRQPEGSSSRIGEVFQDWGIPTPVALQELAPLTDRLTLLASGGIRSGLDMAKAVVLGASLCGIARPFLDAALESPEKVVEVIEELKREFATAMFLMGIDRVEGMRGRRELVLGGVRGGQECSG